jgi:hypothetical protein
MNFSPKKKEKKKVKVRERERERASFFFVLGVFIISMGEKLNLLKSGSSNHPTFTCLP